MSPAPRGAGWTSAACYNSEVASRVADVELLLP
jgi:hypothetical protein